MVEEIFQQGQKTRPAIAADVLVLIQEKKNEFGQPMFDKGIIHSFIKQKVEKNLCK